jgi:hypothetical protein
VKLKTPRGVFMHVPGSMSVKANGGMYSVVSFQAVQALL